MGTPSEPERAPEPERRGCTVWAAIMLGGCALLLAVAVCFAACVGSR
jgi:hypothetical protein